MRRSDREDRTTRVLFLCTGNSARSIIAEAILRAVSDGRIAVESAGIAPKGVNPLTLQALREAGIDASGLHSKHVGELAGQRFDYVITVCDAAAESCPTFPGDTVRIHWSFPDPAAVPGSDEERLAAFRATVSGMRDRIEGLLPILGPS